MTTIKLFDVEGKIIKPTEHCYIIEPLKVIMDEYKDDYAKIYAYLFYMSCQDPTLNPFFNLSELTKEDSIRASIGLDIDTEMPIIIAALKLCRELYETPTSRAYYGIKAMLDRLSEYMYTTQITDGLNGNISSMIKAAKEFKSIRQSFKETYKDLEEEQQSRNVGGRPDAYDLR